MDDAEYEAQRRRLLDDLQAARDTLNRATTRVYEIERDIRILDRQHDEQTEETR